MKRSLLIHLPSALRSDCGGQSQVSLPGATVREALESLEATYPKVYRSVCDERGRIRTHIHLFVNSTLITDDSEWDVELAVGDVLSIMTAVSGG